MDLCFSPRKSVHSIGSSNSSSKATFAISFASARIFFADIPQIFQLFRAHTPMKDTWLLFCERQWCW